MVESPAASDGAALAALAAPVLVPAVESRAVFAPAPSVEQAPSNRPPHTAPAARSCARDFLDVRPSIIDEPAGDRGVSSTAVAAISYPTTPTTLHPSA